MQRVSLRLRSQPASNPQPHQEGATHLKAELLNLGPGFSQLLKRLLVLRVVRLILELLLEAGDEVGVAWGAAARDQKNGSANKGRRPQTSQHPPASVRAGLTLDSLEARGRKGK